MIRLSEIKLPLTQADDPQAALMTAASQVLGIAPAAMKNLFIPFFTTKEKGTGLGLPISQRIVENHGGFIEVRSRPGSGATFTVVLPVSEP